MLRIGYVALAAACTVLAGCATVVRGTTELVVFDSEPTGAEMRSVVYFDCPEGQCAAGPRTADQPDWSKPVLGPSCITPCQVAVKRNEQLDVTFSKAGYEPQTLRLGTRMASEGGVGVAGNVLVGGVTGLVIDAGTNAAYDHHPNPMKAVLVPLRSGVAAPMGPGRR